MMSLPKFTDPQPKIAYLKHGQERLIHQTDELISATGIFDIFRKYGVLSEIGGNYKYGSMVYPDIDVNIIAE